MGLLQSQTSIPIVADESVQTAADVIRLADAGVSGINVKLMKTGGLTPALRIIHLARERGMRIMLGCMVETSLGTTAMAHLMGLADWCDLDAPMLISNDPFDGIHYADGARILVPDRPGIGAVLKQAA
jgi:L-Ala-D/L-Glu epimerase